MGLQNAPTMARTNPGIVYSLALMCTGSPRSFNVAEVTGPMDASFACCSCFTPRAPRSALKFFTVDELVNVTTHQLDLTGVTISDAAMVRHTRSPLPRAEA